MILKRDKKRAYDRVFSESQNSQRDVDIVLQDLLSKTFINKPINGTNDQRNEKEGMRKIGLHLHNMLSLSEDFFIKLDEELERKTKKRDSLI